MKMYDNYDLLCRFKLINILTMHRFNDDVPHHIWVALSIMKDVQVKRYPGLQWQKQFSRERSLFSPANWTKI